MNRLDDHEWNCCCSSHWNTRGGLSQGLQRAILESKNPKEVTSLKRRLAKLKKKYSRQ